MSARRPASPGGFPAFQLCVGEPDNWRHIRRAEMLCLQRALSAGRPATQLEEPLLYHLRRDAHPGEHPYGRTIFVA